MSNLMSLAKFFFAVCLLKKNPQDLPNSLFLLQLLALLNFFITAIINLAVMPPGAALLLALLALVLVYGLTTLLLSVLNLNARLTQTLIAIFGTDLVISGPAILVRYWFQALETSGGQSEPAVLLWLVVFVWNLIVTAHILGHSISKSFGIGLLVSLAYTVIIYNFLFQAHAWLVGQA